MCSNRRNIISCRSSSTRCRYLHQQTRTTITRLGSSPTAALSSVRATATAPTRVREMATTPAPRTTNSWRDLSRRSRTPSTAEPAVVGTTAVVRGRSATACRPRRPCCAVVSAATEPAARWRTAPTRWRGRTPADHCQRPATRRQC